jgi:hypothetical protein
MLEERLESCSGVLLFLSQLSDTRERSPVRAQERLI